MGQTNIGVPAYSQRDGNHFESQCHILTLTPSDKTSWECTMSLATIYSIIVDKNCSVRCQQTNHKYPLITNKVNFLLYHAESSHAEDACLDRDQGHAEDACLDRDQGHAEDACLDRNQGHAEDACLDRNQGHAEDACLDRDQGHAEDTCLDISRPC